MNRKLLVISVIVCIFSIISGVFIKQRFFPQELIWGKMRNNIYYTSPRIQEVNLNNINIINPTHNLHVGETHLVRDLESFFKEQGKNVRVFDVYEYSEKNNFDYLGRSVNIFIYGWKAYYPNKSGINIAYILFPDFRAQIFYEGFDLLVPTSSKYAEKLQKTNVDAVYIPQFSNPKRFKYEYQSDIASRVLFIGNFYGNSPKEFRSSVKYSLNNNIPITIYGKRWDKYIDNNLIKGEYVKNDELHKYYASADIVLNDHRKDMLEEGFISNRIFDVTASGGFIISDYQQDIEDIYGDNIPMYHNEEEFSKLVTFFLEHPEERKQKAVKAQQITLENFTVEKIGHKFLEEIKKIAEKRQARGTIILDD